MPIVWPDGIPGAAELTEWYGGYPGFHDANATIQLFEDGTALLKISGHKMTDRVDEKGFFILEKHFVATFFFNELVSLSLSDFLPGHAILFQLDIVKSGDVFEVQFESSYGFCGSIHARKLSVRFEPLTSA